MMSMLNCRPGEWFFLDRGIGFWNGMDDIKLKHSNAKDDDDDESDPDLKHTIIKPKAIHDKQQIYLIGNPGVWWMASIGVLGYFGFVVINTIFEQRFGEIIESGKSYLFQSIRLVY
jgi:dolichyl-phosphate-mannose--protein O-mannosyl transferase